MTFRIRYGQASGRSYGQGDLTKSSAARLEPASALKVLPGNRFDLWLGQRGKIRDLGRDDLRQDR